MCLASLLVVLNVMSAEANDELAAAFSDTAEMFMRESEVTETPMRAKRSTTGFAYHDLVILNTPELNVQIANASWPRNLCVVLLHTVYLGFTIAVSPRFPGKRAHHFKRMSRKSDPNIHRLSRVPHCELRHQDKLPRPRGGLPPDRDELDAPSWRIQGRRLGWSFSKGRGWLQHFW